MAGDQPAKPRITPFHFKRAKERGDLIAMVTAYDAPSARLAEAAAVDGILVGDSAAMTVLGHDSTVQITVDEMLVLTRAVSRSVYKPLVVADMPFGSFQVSDEEAVRHAVRLVKEGGAGAVKLEGAGPTLTRVRAIVGVGIPVMGHVGLTPQSAVALGGYRVQGRRARDARRLLDEARALQGAGCFAVVIEAMPAVVAARITEALEVPTIGIGAGLRATDRFSSGTTFSALPPATCRNSSSDTPISVRVRRGRSKPTWQTSVSGSSQASSTLTTWQRGNASSSSGI